jgi:hypothetical protein
VTTLPIRLGLAQVSLVGTHYGKTGTRWTLGPTWYDDHQHDEDILPYYDDGNRDLELSSGTAPEPVRNWATQMIAKTTNYRVVGWNGTVPALEQENHGLEFWTMAGVRASYAVDGMNVPWILGRLGDPDDVIVIPRPELPNTTTHIPVRAIATINHTIHRVKVTNA